MKAIIKILRMIAAVLSLGVLIGYYIVTADIPPTVEINELYTFVTVYLITIIITITDFKICIRYNYRGGYFTLCFEVIILMLWIFSYNGVNFHIIKSGVNYIKTILFGGIITSSILISAQLICLIISYLKLKDNQSQKNNIEDQNV